jgi:hypothetical protein
LKAAKEKQEGAAVNRCALFSLSLPGRPEGLGLDGDQ